MGPGALTSASYGGQKLEESMTRRMEFGGDHRAQGSSSKELELPGPLFLLITLAASHGNASMSLSAAGRKLSIALFRDASSS